MASYSNDSAVIEAIKAVDTTNGLTGNAIAKAIGYNKLNDRVKRCIQQLVNDGVLSSGTNNRGYDTYTQAGGSTNNDTANVSTPVSTPEPTPGYTLPKKTYGYKVVSATDGRFAYDISMPDGKELQLTKSERLFIINQDSNYRFIVEDPEDILTAIGTFTQEAGYAHFLVKDLASSVHIKSPADLGTDVILFVTISRHNKAGRN